MKKGMAEKGKLSDELADIIGKSEANRGQVLEGLMTYIKDNNLQDPDNTNFFIPDEKMAKIVGKRKLRKIVVMKYVKSHFFALA